MAAGARVLVVDDDEQGAEATRQYLSLHGLRPQAVNSGEDALRALQSSPFEVVVTDLRLPGIQGEELARQVRAQGAPAPKLISLSGGQPQIAGLFDQCLTKPCRPRALLAAIVALTQASGGPDQG